MTERRTSVEPGDHPASDLAKVRQCLRCQAEFSSNWSGERICGRCKSSKAWRTGGYAQPQSSAGRRR